MDVIWMTIFTLCVSRSIYACCITMTSSIPHNTTYLRQLKSYLRDKTQLKHFVLLCEKVLYRLYVWIVKVSKTMKFHHRQKIHVLIDIAGSSKTFRLSPDNSKVPGSVRDARFCIQLQTPHFSISPSILWDHTARHPTSSVQATNDANRLRPRDTLQANEVDWLTSSDIRPYFVSANASSKQKGISRRTVSLVNAIRSIE